jgi:hypothetical protein
MARVLQQFGHLLKKMLEQLAVRTEDGRLIYQDMLCMSWVDVCDADAFSRQVAPTDVSPQPSAAADQPTMKNQVASSPFGRFAFSPTR